MWIRYIVKLLLLIIHLVVGLLCALTFLLAKRPLSNSFWIVAWWHRRLCRIFGLRVRFDGMRVDGSALLVANHVSWLDIPLLGALLPMQFVAKQEVRDWPLLGWLAAQAGTLFIKRGGRNAAQSVIDDMVARLTVGRSIMLFPEGTTTTGRGVRRFHSRLFGAAIQSQVMVQPIAIRYLHKGRPHPVVPFVGEADLISHIHNLLKVDDIEVRLCYMPPLNAQEFSRKTLAVASRASIMAALDSVSPEEFLPGMPECGAYGWEETLDRV